MRKPIHIAIVQAPPVFLNKEASTRRACQFIFRAAEEKVQVLVFPETWLVGYPVWLDFAPEAGLWDHPPAKALYRILFEQAVQIGDSCMDLLQQAVDQTGLTLVMGVHERRRSSLYNSMLFFNPEKPPGVHRKLMPTYTERLIWGRGDGSTLHVMESAYGQIGGLICWEHWMPLARAAMHAKGEVLHIAQWPMVKEMNLIASRHYAFEGQCFVAAAGGILHKDDVFTGLESLGENNQGLLTFLQRMKPDSDGYFLSGGSGVIAPCGSMVAGPADTSQDLVKAIIDPSTLAEGRLFLDTDGHYSRPDVFELTVRTQAQSGVKFDEA